jgi:hypothetical protein
MWWKTMVERSFAFATRSATSMIDECSTACTDRAGTGSQEGQHPGAGSESRTTSVEG